MALVATGYRHDKAQVRVDHPLLGVQVTLLNRLSEHYFLLLGEEWVVAA
jgi:hypothetical protein